MTSRLKFGRGEGAKVDESKCHGPNVGLRASARCGFVQLPP